MSSLSRRNHKAKEAGTTFLRNGAILLEKLITSGIGERNPIRSFSAKELRSATNNYDAHKIITRSGYFRLYRGFLKRPLTVMKYVDYRESTFPLDKLCFNNIVFTSQVNHKNVLKLIGCCLETEIPILVFESVEYCTLADWIHSPHQLQLEPLLLRHRLKIAMEIANAMAYLHFGFLRPIVFRDLKPSNIILDEHYVAKLYDFSLSESIPEGETHIKDNTVAGTYGFLAPEYVFTGECNEKCDVYSFGSLLLVLLTGQKIYNQSYLEQENDGTEDDDPISYYVKKHINNNTFNEIVDPIIVREASYSEMQQQLQDFIQLISKCVVTSPEDRPTMIDVAKQLRQMYLSIV